MRKVLLIIESCNPEWASVPLVGYNFYRAIAKVADVTLVTHARNKAALLKQHPNQDIQFVEPSRWEAFYYKVVVGLSSFRGRVIWPVRHALQFPLYFFFDRTVLKAFGGRVRSGEFDIVHALTPMMPRYPVGIVRACKAVPFILGPVNGGVPFPPAFKNLARKEFAQFNFLRLFGAYLIPNYRNTYESADLILGGSSYTRSWIIETFGRTEETTALLYENAVSEQFFIRKDGKDKGGSPLRLLFVGRLVPYKGADMLIKALASPSLQDKRITLDVVGSGPELAALKKLVEILNLVDKVSFAGWVKQSETASYYLKSDVFCFPSVREFGGAVVMEAMAAGLPCIVVNNGGIGEYVNDECGYKVSPLGEQYVVEGITKAIHELISAPDLLKRKSLAAAKRAQEFTWEKKGEVIGEIYDSLLTGAASRTDEAAL